MAHRFTIGVEEEFQIIDPETLELRSHVVQLLSSAAARGVVEPSVTTITVNNSLN